MKNKKLIFLLFFFFLISVCFAPFGNAVDTSIIIVTPKEDEVFIVGNNIISWIPPEDVKHVKIELYRGVYFRAGIDSYTNNSGEYIWYISASDNYENDYNYRILITAVTEPDISGWSRYFSIDMSKSQSDGLGEIVVITLTVFVIVVVIILVSLLLYHNIKLHKLKNWIEKFRMKIRKKRKIRRYKAASRKENK